MHSIHLLFSCTCTSILLLTCACGPTTSASKEVPKHECGVDVTPSMAMIRWLDFQGAQGGVTKGIDLDATTTLHGEQTGCGHTDFTSPDGRSGIDNQFAHIVPILKAVGGQEAVDGLFQRTISTGNVLLMLDLRRIDDEVNDACVEFHLWRGMGQPDLDALGRLEAGQTFEYDEHAPSGHSPHAWLKDGVYQTEAMDLELPLIVDGFSLFLSIHNAHFRFAREEDGMIRGELAGGIDLENFKQVLEDVGGVGGSVARIVYGNMAKLADLLPNEEGLCQQISVTLAFEASPAYFYADKEPVPPSMALDALEEMH